MSRIQYVISINFRISIGLGVAIGLGWGFRVGDSVGVQGSDRVRVSGRVSGRVSDMVSGRNIHSPQSRSSPNTLKNNRNVDFRYRVSVFKNFIVGHHRFNLQRLKQIPNIEKKTSKLSSLIFSAIPYRFGVRPEDKNIIRIDRKTHQYIFPIDICFRIILRTYYLKNIY